MKKKQKQTIRISIIVIVSLCLLFLFVLTIQSHDEKDETTSKEEFIERLAPTAQLLQQKYHIFASVSLAQACLESQFGQSELAQKYHNLYGVKASDGQLSAQLETKEYEDGVWKTIVAPFRIYLSDRSSMRDHAKLLANGTSHNQNQYLAVLQARNYRDAAYALQNAGYATDPTYASKLIELIETYELYRYD